MGFRDDLVARAVEEWTWFGKDTGRQDHKFGNKRKETVEPYNSRVADYWLAIPTTQYRKLVRDYAQTLGKLDGTVDLAWSAAYISYCMQLAGAGNSFPYASGHATWMVKAIDNRARGRLNAALVGYRPGEIALKVGDLVGKPRQSGVTYANAVATGWFKSHSDIVVEIDRPNGVAYVIGGNVGQTVSKADVSITSDGKLKSDGGWIVHIQNNIAGGNPSASVQPGALALVG